MIDALFGSKTRVKLLHLFLNNPNRAFYVREITRKIDEQINSVRRELANMLSIGIVQSDNSNNRLYYEVTRPTLTMSRSRPSLAMALRLLLRPSHHQAIGLNVSSLWAMCALPCLLGGWCGVARQMSMYYSLVVSIKRRQRSLLKRWKTRKGELSTTPS